MSVRKTLETQWQEAAAHNYERYIAADNQMQKWGAFALCSLALNLLLTLALAFRIFGS